MKNRFLLNIICIVSIIISSIGICLVMHDVKAGKVVDKEVTYQQDNGNQPPEDFRGDRQPAMNDGGEPPAKPEDEVERGELPDLPESTKEQNEGMNSQRPEKPNGNREEIPDNGMQNMPPEEVNEETREYKYSTIQIVIVVGCSVIFVVSLGLMIVTKLFSKNIYKKQFLVTFVVTSLIGIIVSIGIIIFTQNYFNKSEEFYVDRGEKVKTKRINLDDYDSNVTITESGEYTLSGSFNYSVLVEADDKVILNLNDVTIKANNTAAIANISDNELIINIVADTENTLTDGGSGDYDGCLYSKGPLTIQGDGILNIFGRQEDGEGIATTDNDITINGGIINVESADDGLNAGGDTGGTITINDGTLYVKASGDGIDSNGNLIINGGIVYAMGSSTGGDAGLDADNEIAINGGTVIALGSDMLELPTDSNQKYIALSLENRINSGELITLLNEDGEVVISFEAKETFKTIIISSENLDKGTYSLYQGGSNSGTLENNFYNNGEYTKGSLIKTLSVE